MRTIYLELNKMTGINEFHEHIAELLNFPRYYGKNLDALYDCLTDITTETQIVFPQQATSEEYLGSYAGKVLGVLEDAAADNDDLTIIWR